MMTIPIVRASWLFSKDMGIYWFKDNVRCYGNPEKGPWLEIYPSPTDFYHDAKTRFYESEMPVSGYALMAARHKQHNYLGPMDQNLESSLRSQIARGKISYENDRLNLLQALIRFAQQLPVIPMSLFSKEGNNE